jgi:hypothetical protein
VRPASAPAGCWIGHHGRSALGVRAGGHPQQLARSDPLPASDARPDRSEDRRGGRGHRSTSHWWNPTAHRRYSPKAPRLGRG